MCSTVPLYYPITLLTKQVGPSANTSARRLDSNEKFDQVRSTSTQKTGIPTGNFATDSNQILEVYLNSQINSRIWLKLRNRFLLSVWNAANARAYAGAYAGAMPVHEKISKRVFPSFEFFGENLQKK